MLITSEMIWNKLCGIEDKIQAIEERDIANSIREISLHRACKILSIGAENLIDKVNKGYIKARTIKTNGKTYYKFLISDIYDYQKNHTKIDNSKHFDSTKQRLTAIRDKFLMEIQNG